MQKTLTFLPLYCVRTIVKARTEMPRNPLTKLEGNPVNTHLLSIKDEIIVQCNLSLI